MVKMKRMAQLVHDHIINQTDRAMEQRGVQPEIAAAVHAPPPLAGLAKSELSERNAGFFTPHGHAGREDFLSLLHTPLPEPRV